jgi:hypothetical protein
MNSMMLKCNSRLLVLLVTGLCTEAQACGGGITTPSTPTPVQMAGTWRGKSTLASVSGGECTEDAPDYQHLVGTSTGFELHLQQDGASITQANAFCTYRGAVEGSQFSLKQVSGPCTDIIESVCPGGLALDFRIAEWSMVGVVNGASATGTFIQTENVYAAGGSTVLRVFRLTSTFEMSLQ